MIRQELNPVTCKLDGKQINLRRRKNCRYVGMISPDITISNHRLRWAADGMRFTAPLHYLKRGEEGRKKKEVLHLSRCYTHTHTRQSRGNLERQEEEKSGHTTGRRPKTAKGGEGNRRTSGTNPHGETDLTKTEHTPKPNDTLRRSQ